MNKKLDPQQLTRLVHAEFREMPGLRLTGQQAERLWGLDHATCIQLLAGLVESGFLVVMPDGRYAHIGGSEIVHRPAAQSPRSTVPARRAI